MPDREAHLGQARQNRKIAEELLGRGIDGGDNAHLQWAITAAFYCSVHCIEARLADVGLHSHNHADRGTKMGRVCPAHVYTAHNLLRDFSQEARYLLGPFQPTWVRLVVLEISPSSSPPCGIGQALRRTGAAADSGTTHLVISTRRASVPGRTRDPYTQADDSSPLPR